MTDTLYDDLGITIGADNPAIIAGYRKLAKDCHPDLVDGRRDEFDRITFARDVLLDPQRRKHYDETGVAVPKIADNVHRPAMTALSGAFNVIMGELMKEKRDPSGGDMVDVMRRALKNQRLVLLDNIADGEETVKRLKVPLGRFSEPDGRLEAIAANEVAGAERAIEGLRANIIGIDAGLAYLEGCSYRQGKT
jgi:curved DNA-binding protein CbpA